ncbi:MAG TPA: hydrogenase maturation nickel metallochaperone HypA [Ilumatobacter sp.]|nr:hydrogenase maturation nickel metallochaperone HypA [Ilumatobacter sp.]
MHELSLCRAIADTAVAHANGRDIRRVRVRIGHLRQVVPGTLQHCWDMRVGGGPLDGCVLDIEHVPAVVSCVACAALTTLTVPVRQCARCGGNDVELLSGEEFLIESIDVAPAERTTNSDTERTT